MVMETPVHIVGLAACVALLLASCSSTTEPTSSSPATTTTATATSAAKPAALKTIDPKAFQAVVEAAADKLNVPGTMVLLRTPQGNFDVAVGTTELGTKTPPAADTHFRIASNTKTMTAALIVLLAQDGKLKFSDPVSAYVPDVPNGENITDRKAFEDAQRPLRLHGRSRPLGRHGRRPGRRCGRRRTYWPSRSAIRRSSRPTPPTSTATPTTHFLV